MGNPWGPMKFHELASGTSSVIGGVRWIVSFPGCRGGLGLGAGWPLTWRQVVPLLRWGAEPSTFCAAVVPPVPLGLHDVQNDPY